MEPIVIGRKNLETGGYISISGSPQWSRSGGRKRLSSAADQ
jgi:hypothetical protein